MRAVGFDVVNDVFEEKGSADVDGLVDQVHVNEVDVQVPVSRRVVQKTADLRLLQSKHSLDCGKAFIPDALQKIKMRAVQLSD